jgi:hypothetical protein
MNAVANWVRAVKTGKLARVGQHQKPLTEIETDLGRVKRELAEAKMDRALALSGVPLRGVALDPQALIPFFLTHPVVLRLASVAHLGNDRRDHHIAVVSTLLGSCRCLSRATFKSSLSTAGDILRTMRPSRGYPPIFHSETIFP